MRIIKVEHEGNRGVLTMSKALYRKYRSKSLDEVIGQKHITDILARAISQERVSHAYLLTGPRGVGKTSVARILAYEINGLPYDENSINLDIIEIDAASNNGVEDVRDLREKVQIAPVSAKKKIYIIDEVHMLSKAAFNALLKTLEEPPEHVVFILATTNAEKLPATIISRTQQFGFRPINIDDAVKHLAYIAKQEDIEITEDALKLIAQRSEGSFRDSISLLDQLSSLIATDDKTKITTELIESVLGLAPSNMIDQILEAVETHNLALVVEILDRTFNEGVDNAILVAQLTANIRNQIATKPQLLPLLDSLIDVSKSPQPQLKLLSVLGLAATPRQAPNPKSVALSAPAPEIKVSVAKLEKQITQEKQTKPAIPDSKIKKSTKTDIDKFDWDKLVEYTRQNYIALHSVLSKCKHQLNGTELTIYTNNSFYKKKLDDTKYSPLLSKCLQDIGVHGLEIITLPTAPPPKDSQAAAIAAIMGGGEEVSLESA
ncbi:MAG: polymerase subunit gamma/tau [Patescibacteria group bacterium]|nr:polymerase subunit gamma/tau [Patescibacteria group bacterium]